MLSKQQAGLVGVDNFEVKGKEYNERRCHIHAKKCLKLYLEKLFKIEFS